MKEDGLLEVGDVLYIGGNRHNKVLIDRVTGKRAFSGHQQFDRLVKNGAAYQIGYKNMYDDHRGHIETPGLLSRFNREAILEVLGKTNWNYFPTDVLQQVYDIRTSYTKPS